MKIKKVSLLLSMLGMIITMISCVKDVDGSQLEDVVLNPVYELDFMYSRVDTEELIPSGTDPSIVIPELVVSDTLQYDLVGNDFAVDHIERVEIQFTIDNTIQREFELMFAFLNDGNQQVGPSYTILIDPGLGPDTAPVRTTAEIVMDNETIRTLRDASQLTSSIRVENVSSNLIGVLELKSKATYYINYQL
ncbi:hypothetical protein ACFSTE_12440 [Aquimarina hainanensis]|uniref:DUF1735 domain-containing protein n=1 Tax=Aquimarina hainanensis TaxID=1578017 RepID=A0ABW5NBS3_9FLAO|nr:hypothetical protein [Aquimarina sp. TRL1]QKX03768.1 hypothetical protein HN014_02155 [Aquimarina sp. TRL1]